MKEERVRRFNFLLIMPRIVNKVGDGYSFPLRLDYHTSAHP